MVAKSLKTERAVQAIDVTDLVVGQLTGPGAYLVSCPHTTAALMLMESDGDLLSDLEDVAVRIADAFGSLRHHKNDIANGAAHLTSAAFGTQLFVVVEESGPAWGAYQRIVFLELDGPRERRVEVFKISTEEKAS